MKRLFLLCLLPSLAFGQVLRRDSGTGTFSTAPTFPGAISTGTIQTKGLVSTALDTPVNATFTAGTGTLPNATYYARVSACDAAGCTGPSTETSLAITTGGVNYNWGAVTGATSYKVYCRTTGAEQLCATVMAPTVTWLDDGSVTPSGAMPVLGTSGNISTVSGITARDLTTTAVSGAAAITLVSGSRLYLAPSGSYIYGDATYQYLTNPRMDSITSITTTYPFTIKGRQVDAASAVAVDLLGQANLTTAGAIIARFGHNNGSTIVANIDKDGMFQMGIGNTGATPTCDATHNRGKIWLVNGGAGATDTVSICLKSSADTYSWVTITTGG